LGTLPIDSIRQSNVVKLLDQVEDKSGQTAADQTLAFLRRLFSWHANRSDDFRSPIARGMARSKPLERALKRILTDDELRAVWKAALATESPYGSLVRFLLLTGARRDEARKMPWSEIVDGEWTLPLARARGRLSSDPPALQADLLLAGKLLTRWCRDGTDMVPFSLDDD
jgi:integrase